MTNPSLIYRKHYLIICKFQEKKDWYEKIKNVWEKPYMEYLFTEATSDMRICFKRGPIKHFLESFIFKRIFSPVFG